MDFSHSFLFSSAVMVYRKQEMTHHLNVLFTPLTTSMILALIGSWLTTSALICGLETGVVSLQQHPRSSRDHEYHGKSVDQEVKSCGRDLQYDKWGTDSQQGDESGRTVAECVNWFRSGGAWRWVAALDKALHLTGSALMCEGKDCLWCYAQTTGIVTSRCL